MLQSRIVLKFAVCIFILLTVSPLCFAQEQILSIEEVTQIDLGAEINCIAINEKLNRIYVGVNDTVVVINGTSKQVMKTVKIDLYEYSEVEWIVVDSVNNQIWAGMGQISDAYDCDICLIDGETFAIRDTPWTSPGSGFALDPLRERVYLTDSTVMQGDFDQVNVYSSTDFTELGDMDIPGSDIPTTVTLFDILLDTELNRIYVDWRGTTFVFDCASGSLIRNQSSPDSFYKSTTQFYEDKIYTLDGIMDANTLEYILHFNDSAIAFDPPNSTVYSFYWDREWSSDSSLQATDALTNKTLASSDKIFTGVESVCKVNLQTGEIYLEDRGVLYVLAIISSLLPSPNVQGTSGTYVMVAMAIIIIIVIAAIAIVLRRRKAHV